MNRTTLLLLATVIIAVAAFLQLSTFEPKPGKPAPNSGSAPPTGTLSPQTQPCSKQVLPAPGVKTSDGFSISGTIVDNSGRIAIGAETSALLLVGEDGVTYELHFCNNADIARYARSLAGTPVRVSGTLVEKEKVESHDRKILYVDNISAVLLQPQAED